MGKDNWINNTHLLLINAFCIRSLFYQFGQTAQVFYIITGMTGPWQFNDILQNHTFAGAHMSQFHQVVSLTSKATSETRALPAAVDVYYTHLSIPHSPISTACSTDEALGPIAMEDNRCHLALRSHRVQS